jgi:hypothetical protein
MSIKKLEFYTDFESVGNAAKSYSKKLINKKSDEKIKF